MVDTTNYIWVSVDGSDSNAGTEGSPVRTIQQAVEMATPGTTILVTAGTYVENVKISPGVNSKLHDLTAENDLKIVSVDGPGAATITSADPTGVQSTIYTINTSHLTIDGFHIISDVSKAAGANDGGALKIIGATNGAMEDVEQTTDINILNNTFSGTGISMIKAAMVEDVSVINNVFDGTVSQNFIDMVTVWNSEIIANDFVYQARHRITKTASSQNNQLQHKVSQFEPDPSRGGHTANKIGLLGKSRLNLYTLPDNY